MIQISEPINVWDGAARVDTIAASMSSEDHLSVPASRVRRFDAVVMVLGPALLVVGWVMLITNAGRGANDIWALGHGILFVANAAWVPITLILIRASGWPVGVGRDLTFALALLGSLTIAGQLAIDLVAWALGLDGASLSEFFTAIRARPILSLTVHSVGPSLLFLGLFLASVRLRRGHPDLGLGAALVAGGVVVVAVGAVLTFSLVILGGYVAVLAGFVLIARRVET